VFDLDCVATCDQLMRVLAKLVQHCTLAKALNNFIVIPDDNDLCILLENVDRFGAKNIAGLLIVLSTLRYPRATGGSSDSTYIESCEEGVP